MKENSKNLSHHEKLRQEGWTRRFIYDEPRLSEAKEMYESLGMEVRLEPVIPEELEVGCDTCIKTDPDRYKVIYTRPKAE
jgi:hypothetical protein